MIDKAQINIQKRASQVNESVNNAVTILHSKLQIDIVINDESRFILDRILTQETIESVKLVFQSWNGVNYRACKSVPASEAKYWEIADNWWNRQKHKVFGEDFFCKLFKQLSQYSHKISLKIYPSSDDIKYRLSYQSLLYIQLIRSILCANIKFHRTKLQPLIFDQSLERSQSLKNFLMKLGLENNIEWKLPAKSAQHNSHNNNNSNGLTNNNNLNSQKVNHYDILHENLSQKYINKN